MTTKENVMEHPSFWEQFREDPLALLGPVLALVPIVALVMLVRFLGG